MRASITIYGIRLDTIGALTIAMSLVFGSITTWFALTHMQDAWEAAMSIAIFFEFICLVVAVITTKSPLPVKHGDMPHARSVLAHSLQTIRR